MAACGDVTLRSKPIDVDHDAAYELPPSVTLSTAEWPTEDWWKRFNDPQLDGLLVRALQESPSIRLALAKIDQARAMSNLAGAALEPRMDGQAATTEQRFSSHGTTPKPVAGSWHYVTQGTLGVQYEFDFWGRNRETLAGALGRQHASEIDAAAARLILSTAVVQTYIALQNTDDEIAVEEDQLRRQLDILALTSKRVQAKMDTLIDLKQAQEGIPVRKGAIAALKEHRELLEHELAALVGSTATSPILAPPTLRLPTEVVLPSRLPAELIGRRPDVVALRWRIEASGHDIAAAKASYYPNINLVAFAGLQSLGLDNFLQTENRILGLGPAFSLPIFDGGRRDAQLTLQGASYDTMVETYNGTVLAALKDVADQLTSLKWLQARMSEQTQAVSTAQDAADLVRRRYAVGLATYVQVLMSEDAVLQQRRGLVDLQARALSLDVALCRAIGGGSLDAGSSAAPPLEFGNDGRVSQSSPAGAHDQ